MPVRLQPFKVACSSCNLRELCLPVGIAEDQMERLDAVVSTRRSLVRGEALFRSGDSFTSLYAVRTGFFKTCLASEDGRDQVTGFQMAGELLGLDGTPATRWRWKTRRSASFPTASWKNCHARSLTFSVTSTRS